MTNDNPYTYALTADPDKPLREAREEIKRLTAERDALRVERDEARRMVLILNDSVHRVTAERDEARRK